MNLYFLTNCLLVLYMSHSLYMYVCVCIYIKVVYMLTICHNYVMFFPLLFRSHSMHLRHIYNTKIQLIFNVSRENLKHQN